jgi:DNA repair protein RecN (Recombination protein N)
VVDKQGSTTTVRAVAGEERLREIARLLSGQSSSPSALAHAHELLEQASVRQ